MKKLRDMTPKMILDEIDDHCERTNESAYAFGKRLLGDKAFVWKLRNHPRKPWLRTVKTIMEDIKRHKPKPKKAKNHG